MVYLLAIDIACKENYDELSLQVRVLVYNVNLQCKE